MNDPLVRLTRPSDINSLFTIDLKCYDYPMTLEEWKVLVGQSGKPTEPRILVAEINRKPVALGMWQEVDADVSRIIRLGVIPRYRFQGVGTLLVDACVKHCNTEKKDRIRIVIPDIHCMPGDSDDVSVFLSKVGFGPTGEVVSDYCKMYGDWRDGYVFERKLL